MHNLTLLFADNQTALKLYSQTDRFFNEVQSLSLLNASVVAPRVIDTGAIDFGYFRDLLSGLRIDLGHLTDVFTENPVPYLETELITIPSRALQIDQSFRAALRSIYRISHAEFGPVGKVMSSSGLHEWEEYLKGRVVHYGEALHRMGRDDFDWLVELVAVRIDETAFPKEASLIHNDISRANVGHNKRGRIAILDWDAAVFGDPLFDIARLYRRLNGVRPDWYQTYVDTAPAALPRGDAEALRQTYVSVQLLADLMTVLTTDDPALQSLKERTLRLVSFMRVGGATGHRPV